MECRTLRSADLRSRLFSGSAANRYAGLFAGLLLSAAPIPGVAQGQDSTPGKRYLRIMAELLPGVWDNANQAYFDRRRGLPAAERRNRQQLRIARIEAPALGRWVFSWDQGRITEEGAFERSAPLRFATLADGPTPDTVTLDFLHFRAPQAGTVAPSDLQAARLGPGDFEPPRRGCAYRFRRDAGGFRAERTNQGCNAESGGQARVFRPSIALAEDELFISGPGIRPDPLSGSLTETANPSVYRFERARPFHCHADMPGVGGGRDVPFERYDDITLHDKGGSHWFTTRENPPRRIGFSLTAVTWDVLNEDNGSFNRDSLVLYVSEALDGGERRQHGYAFTAPDAERIGVNLQWILVNCAMVPSSEARPAL